MRRAPLGFAAFLFVSCAAAEEDEPAGAANAAEAAQPTRPEARAAMSGMT